MNLKQFILEQFNNGDFNWITAKALAKRLNFQQKSDITLLSGVLNEMEKEGNLISLNGRFALPSRSGLILGKIKRHERGYAFLIPEDGSEDLFVPPKYMENAYQGDLVLAERLDYSRGDSDECRIVKIVERGVSRVTGVYFSERGFGFVCPDDSAFGADIYIKKGKSGGAKTGQKVVCEITGYPLERNPTGEISAILGNPMTLQTQVKSILISNDAPEVFPQEVINECYAIDEQIPKNEISSRQDFTSLLTVTIDGEDARDFDDAITVFKEQENYILYVHIADVSAYVKSGSAIDLEAYKRGTSIYMPEKVIPMLPEKLCNGVCSLRPNEKRLAVTVKMIFNGKGELTEKCFYKSIIESNHRMTYKEVQAIFEGDDKLINKYSDVYEMLINARELKDKMLLLRDEKGSVDLDVQESKVSVVEGKISVESRLGLQSERLIEQFMISANVAVAEFVFYSEMPGIYRVHLPPSAEKSENFLAFINAVGIKQGKNKLKYPKDYQKILNSLEGNSLSPVVNQVMLKSMQKAEYSAQNQGHFGLNEQCYCHFTSPIRRYPDLIVHRILKGILDGDGLNVAEKYSKNIGEIAQNCSLCERKADLIERAVDDVYVCKFMSQFLGDYFEAIISGVTSFGVFVRLENSVEGLVPLEYLPRGKYDFDAKLFTLKSTKHNFSLGQKVCVKLTKADIQTGKIDFAYVGKF